MRFETEDGIGVITIGNPPVSARGAGLSEGITAAVERGGAKPACAPWC